MNGGEKMKRKKKKRKKKKKITLINIFPDAQPGGAAAGTQEKPLEQ